MPYSMKSHFLYKMSKISKYEKNNIFSQCFDITFHTRLNVGMLQINIYPSIYPVLMFFPSPVWFLVIRFYLCLLCNTLLISFFLMEITVPFATSDISACKNKSSCSSK